ncbi:MAG: hypothetical protein MMC23_004184 [Stictis urceolatum]|nr:hypothetical protein [Stictis urceolata]
MTPTSRFALLGRGPVLQREQDSTAWKNETGVPPRDPKTMTKAERLLGVAEGSGAHSQRKWSDSSKRSQRGNAFASAFSDLKGVLGGSSSSRNSSRGRRTPSSPAIKTATDSDSMTSMTSPTFDATGSTSTLPSYYDPPMSPYFSNRGSSGPSSPNDFEGRHDYHAAINPHRHKHPYEADMPAISEVYDMPEEKTSDLPPLEKAPLSPNPPTTPKSRGSFGPVSRLRSPSSTSVATESTAKGKWLGWRQSRLHGREITYEPVPRSAERRFANGSGRTELAGAPRPPNAVEDWLARADLERRPSQSSVMTKSTVPHSFTTSALSPSSSQLSIRTLTTQKDVVLAPSFPPLAAPPLRHAKSSDDIIRSTRTFPKTLKAGILRDKDLLVESVLSFSSSEDESSDSEFQKPRRSGKQISMFRTANNTPGNGTGVSNSVSKDDAQILQAQQKPTRSLNQSLSPPRPVARYPKAVPTPFVAPRPRQPLRGTEWQASDATELSNICVATAAKIYPGKTDSLVEIPTYRHGGSVSSLSPTSKVMVVSKKEERLLATMREKKEQLDMPRSDGRYNVVGSAAPIIQVSPPRKRKKRPSALDSNEEMTRLDENKVLSFPAPPTPKQGRSGALALKLSTESLIDLPEVVVNDYDQSDAVSLPSILLSPSIAGRMSMNFSVSDLTQSESDGRPEIPNLTLIPSELYGSVPDLTEVLHTGLGHKNSGRSRASSKSKMYVTGLEHHGANGEDDDFDDDIAKYVMASVM